MNKETYHFTIYVGSTEDGKNLMQALEILSQKKDISISKFVRLILMEYVGREMRREASNAAPSAGV